MGSIVLYSVVRLFACLPLPVLYFFTDLFLYPVVYYLVGYRRRIVRMNLKNSFPEKNKAELRQIERKFYHHFCDCFAETVRVLGMSEKEALRRVECVNPQLLIDLLAKGQGVLLLLGHYGNWEYQSFLFKYFQKVGIRDGYNIYKPLKNKAFDALYYRIRTRFGGRMLDKDDTYRTLVRLRRQGRAPIFGIISDQSPLRQGIQYWAQFLNQDTAMFAGPERMAKQTNFAVVYADVEKVSRGHYRTTFEQITDNPKATDKFEITEKYARLMEATILRQPAYWLWTHKRWKHKREAGTDNQNRELA